MNTVEHTPGPRLIALAPELLQFAINVAVAIEENGAETNIDNILSDATELIARIGDSGAAVSTPAAPQISRIEARVDEVVARNAKLIALLEWVSRCAKMPAPAGIDAYAIRADVMAEIREVVAPHQRADGRPLLDFPDKEGS